MSKKQPNIVFAGTPEIAATILDDLIEEYPIAAVLSQPDRPAGRGRKLTAPPVKILANKHNIPIFQPETLKNNNDVLNLLTEMEIDLMIVVAYGLLLPKSILSLPRLGCLNIHTSILPKWRGAAPITHAILAGDAETGVSLMKMDAGLDTGPVYAVENLPLVGTETTQTLTASLAKLASKLLLTKLPGILSENLNPVAQDDTRASYASKITKTQALIDWQKPAKQIHAAIRAYNPWPISFSLLNNERVRIWNANLTNIPSKHIPGTINAVDKTGIFVDTADYAIQLTTIQLPNAKALPVSAVLNNPNHPFQEGFKFG